MDTKPYDIDSPYTSLTLKPDESYYCQQQRLRRRERHISLCAGLTVAICILSVAFSTICAVYCSRVSSSVLIAEERILKHVTETNTPYGSAESLRDAVTNRPTIETGIDDTEGYDDDEDDSSEYIDEDESSEYIDDDDDDDDDEYADDEYDNDDDDNDYDDEFTDDFDSSSGDSIDGSNDLESSDSIEKVDIDGGDSGYFTDDEDDTLEGSASQDVQAFKRRLRRETATQKPKKNRKNKGKKSRKGKDNGKVKMGKLRFLPAAQFDGSVTSQTIQKHCSQYSQFGTKGGILSECVHVKEMEGQLCNNQSFLADDKNQALRILKPEPWVNKNTSPVDISNSVLTARSSGIHLVYAQVTFSGYEAQKSAYVVVTSGTSARRLSCNADTAVTNIETEDNFEKNLSTCSIFGLVSLKPGDKLELQTGNRYAAIERVEGATYFGIVQLNKNKK